MAREIFYNVGSLQRVRHIEGRGNGNYVLMRQRARDVIK
jgi:hypothetical protein